MAQLTLRLSVVVASFNQRRLVCALLEQLLAQDYGPGRLEVIVTDDGSTDGTLEHLSTWSDPRVRLISHPANSGRAAARNRGIQAVDGDVVVLLDGDHSVRPDFLTWHARAHEAMECAVVGRSVYPSGAPYGALHSYLNGTGAAKRAQGARLPGRYFAAANCSIPRHLLFRIGALNERFTAWGGEDLDLGKRLEHAGVPIVSEPRALAFHHHPCTLEERLERLFGFGRAGIPLLLEIHPELLRELKLDRVVSPHEGSSMWASMQRALVRCALGSAPNRIAQWIASTGGRWQPPRLVFDYLHFSAYAKGYLTYLAEKGAAERSWDMR